MNSTFNIKRFWNTLKRDLVLNKQYPIIFLITIMFSFLLYIFPQKEISSFWFVIETIVFLVISSSIGNNFKSKNIAFNTLILPASKFEKFIVRIINFYIIPLIIYIIGISIILFSTKLTFLVGSTDYRIYYFWFIIFIVAIQSSIFVLGGMIFKRFSMFFTFIIECVFICFTFYLLVHSNLMFLDPMLRNLNNKEFSILIFKELLILLSILTVNFSLSYILFRRKQIIK